ncbi:bile acid-transporting ATPase YBT1 [Saccharomyces paradoxus]|uniref:Bile acid-transporting ATPase YBT1 n=1 Tax=Saccharomyces paradoxus TaxID=27291 RepID=A0A8B8UVJ8_SACPA|nr:Ybt1 [Saccharomyces paradoxus]QHS74704.1 Ybt1 [Saccharomyces paradoxus]
MQQVLNSTRPDHQFWFYDDVTWYGRTKYLNYYTPLVLSMFTALFVTYNIWKHYYYYNVLHLKERNPIDELLYSSTDEDEQSPLINNNTTTTNYVDINCKKDALKNRHFSLEKLKSVKLNGEPHGEPEIIRRGFIEKSKIILEFFLVLSQVIIHSFILLHYVNKNPEFTQRGTITGLVEWCLLFVIVSLRLANVNQNFKLINKYPGNLWSVSFINYLILFISMVLPFRSIFIHHINTPILRKYYISQISINLALFLLLFFARIRNNFAIIYKTDSWITPSPEPVTSIAGFICWAWLDSFVWKAHKVSIKVKDIWGLMMQDYSFFVVKKFRYFVDHKVKKKRIFSLNLFFFFSNYLVLQCFWAFLGSVLSFIPTVLLKRILEYVEDQSSAPSNLAWFYVTTMFVGRILVAICQAQALFFGRRVCIRMKSIIISEIYTKALRRKISTNKTKPTNEDPQEINDQKSINGDEESTSSANLGAIINLMAIDAFKVSEICGYLHSFLEAFVMTVVALALLYHLLGFAAIVGVLIIVAMLPLNYKLAKYIGDLQKKNLAVTDNRIQKLNEAFQAIRIIKYFSWEENFEKDINTIRENELSLLLMRSIVWSISSFLWFVTPTIVTASSFAYYIYVQGEVLTTPVAFTALSLFTLLRDPLDRLSDMLSFVVQSKVSLDRVQDFLNENDTKKYDQLTVDPNGKRFAFENSTISWDKDNQDFKLKDLNIEFKTGKLNVVIGPTGSGKTSLLMALLGEMYLLSGKVVVPALEPRQEVVVDANGTTNSIAYCSQAAWLLNDTVKNNILFNSPFNEARYKAVVEACGLKRDFEILKAGDLTEIGEKGITLSGGQKQRVSLARALYSNARHVLLDDCLSAVDSHTASWIYDNCITGPLMEDRTCILVSHNIALTLRNAELVVLLEDGRVKDQGDPIDMLQKGLFGEDELVKSSILSRANSSANLAAKSSTSLSNLPAVKEQQISMNNNSSQFEAKKLQKPLRTEAERAEDGKLIEEETKEEGVVGMDVYKWYLKIFGGWKIVSFLASLFLIAQLLYIGQSWWVRAWASHNIIAKIVPRAQRAIAFVSKEASHLIDWRGSFQISMASTENQPTSEHSTMYYLILYLIIGLAQSLLGAGKTILNFVAGINASRKIFNMILNKVLHSKIRFFDATPTGRIMNRFSKDIEAIDQELTPYIQGAFYSLIECLSTVILITFITPQFLSVAIVVSILYYFVGYFYMAGSRELKRFESISRSPIYQHFSETLVGVTTIRAFGDEGRFMQENLHKIDENNKPFFYLWVANRWLAFRIDMIGSLVIFGAGLFILFNINHLDSGMAGISLTYAISFTEGALWLVRLYSEVEMNMNSVERVKEYMEIEQEPYNQHKEVPPPQWPQDGKIEVNDLSLRYAPNLPRVIKNVSFSVDAQSKIGIVGRTGAGKSTIITALFRFLEPETGHIKIDNIDISGVDLQRLRRSITIIPQDPTLFSGTIKTNLDPYDEFSDKKIFEALKRVNLISEEQLQHGVTREAGNDTSSTNSENVNKFLDLSSEISEGGSNLSQGQRQLMCLARSLLRSPKIILLDEATASIDYGSDAKIQETIRKEFQGSTILTIAHRLRSVIDYDKILVMDAGEVKEYDHPYSLLLNKQSAFYSMCEHSGELEILIEMAKKAFVEKLNSKKD